MKETVKYYQSGWKETRMQDVLEAGKGIRRRAAIFFCVSFIILIKSVFQSYLWVLLL